MREPLIHEEENDYVFDPKAACRGVWITVDSLSVYIKRDDEGVGVAIYRLHHEAEDAIAETWACYNEGKEEGDVEA